MLSESITKRLMLTRYLYTLAADHARSHREVAGFACINMLQDALEIFLLAAAERVNATIHRQTAFEQYLDKINERLLPEALPFRSRLIEINKMRVLSKHDGIPPNAREIDSYVKTAREFFEQASQLIFKQDFWTISLVELLNNGEKKDLLKEAEKQFEAKDYSACLISCRRAFFLEFESDYDVKKFREADDDDFIGFFLYSCKAPYYVRKKDWIAKNVKDPFDYIQFDHSRVDADLVMACTRFG